MSGAARRHSGTDRSVDFVFSFDSLVHAELDVVEAYLTQLASKLAPHGVAFLHHSNLAAFRDEGSPVPDNSNWSSDSVSAQRVRGLTSACHSRRREPTTIVNRSAPIRRSRSDRRADAEVECLGLRIWPRFPVPPVAIADARGTWHETDAEAAYSLDATQLGHRRADFSRELEPTLPALGVLQLPGGAVVSKHGWVYDRRGRLVLELSWFGRHWEEAWEQEHPGRRPRRLEPLRGRSLTAGTTWGPHYGHLLPDSLGRLAIAERAGFAVGDFDHVLLPPARTPGAQTLLGRLGVPAERVRMIDHDAAYVAEELFAPSYPGARRQYSPVVIEYLRGLARPSTPPRRKLYVTRRGYGRNPMNVDEVEDVACEFGFEVYDPAEHPDQASDFAEASVVVGPSGSALHSIVFCAPGTTVVELMSDAHVYAYHATMAQAAELRYGYVLGESDDVQQAGRPSRADFVVARHELLAALEWAQSDKRLQTDTPANTPS